MKNWIKNIPNIKFTKSEYSQYFQADLLNYIFENLNVNDEESFCVEFGYNSKELSPHANTTSLIIDRGWKSIFFDGDYENKDINLYKEFLTTENIVKKFAKYNIPLDVDYISIDIDSTDLWLFKELLSTYRPKVYSVEYNSNFPINQAITLADNPLIYFNHDKAFGASLKALNLVALQNGYSLICVVPTLDAFFIRNDLIDDGTDEISFSLSKWKSTTNIPNHPRVTDESRINELIDYESFVENSNDLKIARNSAKKTVKKYIAGRGNIKTKYIYFNIYISKFLEIFLKSSKIRKIKTLHLIFQKFYLMISPYPYNLDIHHLR